MGQTISILDKSVIGNVAVFEMNRSLTGQVGEAYASASETETSVTFPAVLARRLFEAVPTLDHVFVAGSSVSVRSGSDWTAEAYEKVEFELRNFFTYWDENRA